MRSIFGKTLRLNSIYTQMLIIVITFAIMGVSSFFFATGIEHNHLVRDSENALAFTKADIAASLLEPETFLNGYSETIRSLILMGKDNSEIALFMSGITDRLIGSRERMLGFVDVYGFIRGEFISDREGIVDRDIDDFCYATAVAARGRTVVADPFLDNNGNVILTFSRHITDDNGNSLGVVCLDMNFSRILNRIIHINLTQGSYGILLNRNLDIIAHPIPSLVGENLRYIDSGLTVLADELAAGQNINERRLRNYMYENTIVYFRLIIYDLFLGIVIPVQEYYRSATNMAAFLILIGSVLAAALCVMLYYITQAKIKSDMRTQQKSNFLATMSHEIRTPLNAILGMTEIQMQNAAHPPSTSEAFLKINNSGNLLLNIINDILDLSKIEAGKLELTPVKYEVASLINDIIQLNYIRYESKPIEFKIEIDENIPSELVGDELRIKQILNNLLSNAFKYTDRGEVTLSVNAECVGRGGGAVIVTLIFQIKDTGQGMTAEQINKLFDEYTRFNLEANRTTEGAGLGMTITRNLVNLMYGKINVKSALGQGTSVTVRLPQKTEGVGIRGMIGRNMAENLRAFKLDNAIQLKKTQISHEYMPYGRILIVDDVETNLYVAKGLMSPYGLNIDLATSGFDAIEKINNGAVYDVVFMDHMMPKMDGIETTKKLRQMGYNEPVVALTANALAGQAEMFLKNGFDDFISKPIDIRQLNIALNRLIRDKQPLEVVAAAHKEKAEMDKKRNADQDSQQIDSQLAEIFARDAEKAIGFIGNCIKNNMNNEKDLQMYIINVHAMKSALANIGKIKLSATALRLEQAGREKDINVILSETDNFLEDLGKVVQEIKPKDEDNAAVEDTEESLLYLSEKLEIIKDACIALDKKTAKTILNEIREKTWSSETKEIINSISTHLLHSEFEETAALVEKYKK